QQQIEGKYALLGQLEDQGSAEVYKVRHLFLEEVRLITVVHPPSLAMTAEVTERFLRDARAAIKLRHPNIAQLHDFAIDEEGTAYIVTEFIEGLTLEEALAQDGPPPLELTLNLARQALRALAYLHKSGMVHRDISPDKLMLTRDEDGRALVKWVDLGTAQVLAVSDGLPAGTGVFPARPKYASPEQFSAAGGGTVDARGDLYSFGVVLYELLTGRLPITGRDPFSLMVGHLSTPPVSFAESDPEAQVPDEVREILLSTLAKKPEERIASAEELARRLASVQDPLADDRGEYLQKVLQRARQKTAVVVPPPPPVEAAAPKQVAEPAPPPAPVSSSAPAPVATPPAPRAPEPPRAEELGPILLEPLPQTPVDVRPDGAQWDRVDMAAFRTQALRSDPVIPSEATRRTTLMEPLPEPPPAPADVAPPSPPASRPILLGVGVGMLAALLIGAGWWLGGSHRPDAPEAAAPATSAAPAPPPPLPTVEVKPETAAKREKGRRKADDPANPSANPANTPSARHEARVAAAELSGTTTGRSEEAPKASPPPGTPPERGRMITGGVGVENAEVLSLGKLVYPERARGTGKKPNVKVAVLVDENGNVLQARIKEGDPSGLGFNEAARDAAQRTHFLPATQNGVPGKSWNDLAFEFVEPAEPSSPGPP
ncbi:MAG TPA: TonB family protein, partial [Thermoanaerobaculia bacterium]|nr:TonB family protein [Thermoanaerobaculia bacterium]